MPADACQAFHFFTGKKHRMPVCSGILFLNGIWFICGLPAARSCFREIRVHGDLQVIIRERLLNVGGNRRVNSPAVFGVKADHQVKAQGSFFLVQVKAMDLADVELSRGSQVMDYKNTASGLYIVISNRQDKEEK